MKTIILLISIMLFQLVGVEQSFSQTDWSKFALIQANGYWDLKVFDINENFDVISDGKGDAYLRVLPPFLYNDTLRYELQRTIVGMGTSRGHYIYMSHDTLYASGGVYPIQFPFNSPGSLGPRIPESTFIMFADFGSDSWESYYQEYEDFSLNSNVHFTGYIKINGEKGEISALFYEGKEHEVLDIIQYCEINGKISLADGSETQIENYVCEYHTYCSVDIGWVRWYWFFPEHNWGYGEHKWSGKGYCFEVPEWEENTDVIQQTDNSQISIHPNPFSQSASITYELTEAVNVSLELFDMLGNKVATLVDDWQEAGQYNYELLMEDYGLPAGVYVYVYVFRTGGKIESGKIIHLK
jgi:hypothetical protein